MLFGLNPRQWGNFFDEALEQTIFAEKVGFSSVWYMEHHGYGEGYIPSPLMALAALAPCTKKMILGTNIIIPPLHNPVKLAEDVAILDVISKGRVILGVGVGYRKREFESFNVKIEERGGRLDEIIPLLRRLWREDRVTHHGRYYRLSNVTVTPKPVQVNGPPIWIGAWSERAIERAARLGDVWYPGPVADLEKLKACLNIYKRALKRLGKDSNVSIPLIREGYVGKDDDSAWADVAPSLTYMYKDDYSKTGHPFIKVKEEFSVLDFGKNRFIVGGVDRCIEEIEKYRKELNVNHLILRIALPKLPHKKVMNSIKLIGEKVIPYFKEK
jgi:probable F420-dependent oxidoreductase